MGEVTTRTSSQFSNEDGEVGKDGRRSLTTGDLRNKLAVDTGSSEEVEVAVEDDVHALFPVRGPVRGTHEGVGDHQWDVLVDLLDLGVDSTEVCVQVVDSVGVRDGVGGGEVGEVVTWLVDGREGELVRVSGGLDEFEDLVCDLHRVVEVCRVVPPADVRKGLTDVEEVSSTGKTVEANDDVHALADSMVGDSTEVLKLITVVELGSGDIDPVGVG